MATAQRAGEHLDVLIIGAGVSGIGSASCRSSSKRSSAWAAGPDSKRSIASMLSAGIATISMLAV